MPVYSTTFNLRHPVNDLQAAQSYLDDGMMTPIIKGDSGIDAFTRDAITQISWNLANEESGTIDIETTRELGEDELGALSRWISGQNSDGLGEGFEQQEFANTFLADEYELEYGFYEDDEYYQNYDPPNEDDYWVMSSFDWTSNKYPLERIG